MCKLYVVGIGPGDPDDMTLRAHRTLEACQVIVGYPVYVDLIKDRYPGKEYLTTPMTQEAARCRLALDRAREGQPTALVCSGDSGVYGLACLVYALRGEDPAPAVEIVPGLTAACSGGALLGAPLTHDFAVISLSDRLTPWPTIAQRLTAAAQADLTIVLYNPASRGRPDHLRRACDLLLAYLPPDRVCGLCRNIGRTGQETALLSLDQLRDTAADMFSTAFIGSSRTQVIAGRMVTPRGYRDE